MKKLALLLAYPLLFTIIAGCSKQDSTTPSMNAYVNDTNFTAFGPHVVTTYVPTVLGVEATVTATNLSVSGTSANTVIAITVKDTAHTYIFSPTSSNSCVHIEFSSPATNGQLVSADSGIVTVTKAGTGFIQGTFSFVVQDTLGTFRITSGQFTGTN